MNSTLLLDQSAWDLVLDAAGNIAVADAPYALAQDVASAVRTVAGELWYDTSQGVPYLTDILDKAPSLQFVKTKIEAAALTVPGIVKARCLFSSLSGRTLTGQIQVIDTDGTTNNVSF